MKIRKVYVEDLFDAFSYPIEFKEHEPISIIHAPNGYGKTTVFKIIKATLDLNLMDMFTIPFSRFLIEFTDNHKITIEKKGEMETGLRIMSKSEITYSIYREDGIIAELTLPMTLCVYDWAVEDGVEEAIHRLEMQRRHTPSEDRANQPNFQNKFQKYKETMDTIKKHISIHFIDANRLYVSNNDTGTLRSTDKNRIYSNDGYVRDERGRAFSRRRDSAAFNDEKILIDAGDIFNQIQQVRQRYSLESEKKDRDFPDRLVQFVESSDRFYSDEEIAEKLKNLEEKRIELEKAGLALTGKKSLSPPKDINDTMRKFYTLYIDDTFKKLSLYDDIKRKLELFIEIINTKTSFSNKVMRIDNERGIVFEPINSLSGKKRNIPLSKLSSGEKHDFILFYELIFKSDSNSVFLIDEPEISLHVAWQMEFIDVLKKICNFNNMQAIVATHSPDIVNGHDDLLISLGIEEEENDV